MALIDKASLLMVPSTYEDGTLYNVLPSGNKAPDETGNNNGYDQTRADFTFSRGSNLAATRVNASGLIEKGRANYILYSQEFDNAYWNKAGFSVTANQTTAPNGTLTADLIDDGTASGNHYIEETESIGGGVATASIHAKYVDTQYLWLAIYDTQYRIVVFDIQNGTIGNKSQSSLLPTIEDLGNGWYRCSVSHPDNTRTDPYISFGLRDDNVAAFQTFTGTNRQAYVWGAQLENGLVATPYIETGATTATAGVLENTPRIDYSSGAGALLLEPQRTNLIPQSEYFGAWTASGLTISSNEATSLEGVSNAAKLTLPSGSAIKRIALSSMPVTAVARSYSFFVKSDEISAVQLVHSGDVQGYARFDISSGVVGSKGSKTTSDIEDYGNGWYRCIANFDATNSFGSTIYLYINDSATGGYGGSTSAQGDLFIYGAQYEEGTYPSSYVPTYGSAATRGADSCSVTGASDVIGQTEGTIYVDLADYDGNTHLVTLGDGTASNYIMLYISSGAIAWLSSGGFSGSAGSISAGDKAALAYKENDSVLYLNGVQMLSDTSNTIPNIPNIYLNDNATLSNKLHLQTKQVVLFNERLSNTELATLTTL